MVIESEHDLTALKKIGEIVAMAREEMAKSIRPGISTAELDEIGAKFLSKNGARSAPKSEYNFPGTTCISLNDVAAHGIPNSRLIEEGDIVNIDISAELDGYFADTGITLPVGSISPLKRKLLDCSLTALKKAIQIARAGVKINQLGKTIYNEATSNGFTIISNLSGHGIGRKLHDEPYDIVNYYDKWDDRILTNGVVLAIETFISNGGTYVIEEDDGWSLRTPNNKLVAQFEHTIVVTKSQPIITTL